MIECRTIREDEAKPYLRLLCRVFNLDYARAEQIFFHEPFFSLDRKWGLFEDGELRSLLTTVPLMFNGLEAIGIAGVGTIDEHRGRGLGQRLLEATLSVHSCALLFARQEDLYRRCGFQTLDGVIRAKFSDVTIVADSEVLTFEEVQQRYNSWADRHPNRLLRDETRWKFWKWNLRMCSEASDGYLCQEGDAVREVVFDDPPELWPIFENAEWFGLASMAQKLNLPIDEPQQELMLMGRGFSDIPEMFMTDQF